MPQHPGSSHNPSGGGSGFSASPATPSQGMLSIPQGGILPSASGAPSPEALSEIVQMLRGGHVGAERFLEVLGLLAAQTAPSLAEAPSPQPGVPSLSSLIG